MLYCESYSREKSIEKINNESHSSELMSGSRYKLKSNDHTTGGILQKILTMGSWDNVAGDIVPVLITQLPSWPERRQLIIDVNGYEHFFPERPVEHSRPLRLRLNDNHYTLLTNGREIAVPGDGDCFYRAVLTGLTPEERFRLLEQQNLSPDSPESVQRLRCLMATYASEHADTISPLISSTISANATEQARNRSDNDILFSFLYEEYLQEAREFRRKGYNSQIPEVDATLVTQLHEAVNAATPRLFLQAPVMGPLGSQWIIEQIHQIDILIDGLSKELLQSWVNHEVISKSGGGTGNNTLGSRKNAQSLVRRLESNLRTLMRVIDLLLFIDSHNTPEKRCNMLANELTDAFSASDENSVLQTLEKVTADAAGDAAWSSLMQAREATWEREKSTLIRTMIDTASLEAEKDIKKTRALSGAPQTFFRNIAEYLQKLSTDLKEASINVNQDASPYPIQEVNDHGKPLPSSYTLWQKVRTEFKKGKLQLQILAAKGEATVHTFDRIIPCDYLANAQTKKPEQIIGDSIIRSILWQWQQPAIKVQHVSGALLSKLKQLKKIEGMLSAVAEANDETNEQAASDVPVSHQPDTGAQIRQWIDDSIEQTSLKTQLAAKLALLKKLLDSEIVTARKLVGSLGKTKGEIQALLERQMKAILEMAGTRYPDLMPSLKAVEGLLPGIVSDLTASIVALNDTIQAAHYPTLAKAERKANNALLLANLNKENISAASSWLTERPLEENSRSARIAKHWAKIARENHLSNCSPSDAKQVLSSLKEHNLLEGIVSAGDPEGYLFATRLAMELENARNDELILPMSPEQYAALEKGLIEYIVKWGQRRLSSGIARTVVELSFEQALDAVTFQWTNFARLPYKILKASIKIPYKVSKVKNYIMPGDDIPYKAVHDMVQKKLKQLGFNLIMAPLPGMLKFVVGATLTEVAALYNAYIEDRESGVDAVYQSVVEGKKSKKIKINLLKASGEDFVIDSTFIAASKGINAGVKLESQKYDTTAARAQITECQPEIDEKISDQMHLDKDNKVNVADLQENQTLTSGRSLVRRRRAILPVTTSPSHHEFFNAPVDVELHSEHFDHDRDISYKDFTEEKKRDTYQYAIRFILQKVVNDEKVPENIKANARVALAGANMLVPVDLYGHRLNNTVLLPESEGSKYGLLINLDSDNPYYIVDENERKLEGFEDVAPYDFNKKRTSFKKVNYGRVYGMIPITNTGPDIVRKIRAGTYSFGKYFNTITHEGMNINDIAHELASTIESDYKHKGETIINKRLISRAIAGAHIPVEAVFAKPTDFHLETTWAALKPAEYLRAFARPFSTFSKDIQLIHSSINGETIQQTELHAHEAEYIGHWFDVTVGAVTSFTPAGWVLNSAQSLAEITADCTEGKEPDPLAVASLIVGNFPGGKVAAKVGKFSQIGGSVVKYGLMLGNKTIDLAIVGRSIKTAVETGEPLVIYQAFLAAGLSLENSHRLTKEIVSKLNTHKAITMSPPKSTFEPGGSLHNDPNVYSGPSGRQSESFDQVTNHRLNLNKATRFILKTKFAGTRVQAFDVNTSKFVDSNDFELAHIDNAAKKITKKISSDTQVASLNDIQLKTDIAKENLTAYEGDDKIAIYANLRLINSMIELIKENSVYREPNIERDIYVLVRKNADPEDVTNHFGLVELEFSLEEKNLTINNLFAHPYVVINKYPLYRDFLIDKKIITKSELERYNIKNIARYIGVKALKSEVSYYESFPKLKVNSFTFNGANPITQRLGNALENLSKFFASRKVPDTALYDSDDFVESRTELDPYQKAINHIKHYVKNTFKPLEPIKEESDEKTEEIIKKLLGDYKASIVADDIVECKTSSDVLIKNFSSELIASVDRSYEKVMSVKSLFERAENDPRLKDELKTSLNEAAGLNDETIFEIDKADISAISDMAYNKFRHNVDTLHDYLLTQKLKNYNAFVLYKYQQPDPSQPDALALPFDAKKRILVAIRPENERHGGLVDTVAHEASHVASYTLDHTYMGNVRLETGSFPTTFEPSVRESRLFFADERISNINTKYVLGLSKDADVTEEQSALANIILQNSKLAKADTLLNAAEYNAYIIDVLSRAKIKDSHIEFEERSSRRKRSAERNYDTMIMVASMNAALPYFKSLPAGITFQHDPYGVPEIVYTVQIGETLKSIAEKIYEDESMANKFYEVNKDRMRGMQVLKTGLTLKLPEAVLNLTTSNREHVVRKIPASVYTVKPGESLGSIAGQYYFSEGGYDRIYKENMHEVINSQTIHVGQSLTMPGFNYVVKSGDTLDTIATKFYGSKDKILDIYTANPNMNGFDLDYELEPITSVRHYSANNEVYVGQ